MTNKIINIAVIGAGSMGRTHSYAIKNIPFYYKDLPFLPVCHTICSRTLEKAQTMKDDYGYLYAECDYDKVVSNDEIDIIDICTPNIFHYKQIKSALEHGKHIMCEKPLVVNGEECDKLEELLSHYPHLIHRTVFNNRHLPVTMRARQIFEEGRIGRVLSFRASYRHSSATDKNKNAGWKQNKDICGGGVLFDLGSHIIDLLSFIMGDGENEFKSICGLSQIAYSQRKGIDGNDWNTNADEAFYALAKLKCGACGSFEVSKVTVGTNDDILVEIFGEKGALRFDMMQPNFLEFYDNTAEKSPYGGYSGFTRIECTQRYDAPGGVFPSVKSPVNWVRGHVHNMYCLCNDVFSGTISHPDFYDGIKVNRIMDAAYKSSVSGKWEKIF
ncbi:MAG: Gfo/Idh/MocA family oxidoreductase [Clostridia bacterium]|nr:Gfo/Idh/MocA family oxidoreductase [Clostridia bacterium]